MLRISLILMAAFWLSTPTIAQVFNETQFEQLMQEIRSLRTSNVPTLTDAHIAQLTSAIQSHKLAISDEQFEKLLRALSPARPWLEIIYWITQSLLLIVAGLAAWVALTQVRTAKLFEILKYLQSTDVRDARRVVIREILPIKWVPERLEREASTVCSTYDVLGRLLAYEQQAWPRWLGWLFRVRRLEDFFATQWAPSILDTYEALEGFIEARRRRRQECGEKELADEYMRGFTTLYRITKNKAQRM